MGPLWSRHRSAYPALTFSGISSAGIQIDLDLSCLTSGVQARIERAFFLTTPAWTQIGVRAPVSKMASWTESAGSESDRV